MADEVLFDNELLIHLVHERPILWDKTLDSFKDRISTKEAWLEVCGQLNSDFYEMDEINKNNFGYVVTKKWKHLRDAFVKAQKRAKRSKASGYHSSKIRKYIFYDELQFLRKVYDEMETEETYNDEEQTSDEPSGPQPPPKATIAQREAKAVVSKPTVLKRHPQKIDDVNLKTYEVSGKGQDRSNDKLTFFKSLLGHVDKFDDNQWLQCQMEFLQVITKIKKPSLSMPHLPQTPSTSQIQQQHQLSDRVVLNVVQKVNIIKKDTSSSGTELNLTEPLPRKITKKAKRTASKTAGNKTSEVTVVASSSKVEVPDDILNFVSIKSENIDVGDYLEESDPADQCSGTFQNPGEDMDNGDEGFFTSDLVKPEIKLEEEPIL